MMKRLKFLTVAIVFMLLAVMAAGCPATDNTTPSSNSPPPPPPKPAEYVVSDLTLPSGAILAGSPVSVAVTIQNIGEVSGTYNAALKVEKDEVAVTLPDREVVLAAGESKTVSFSITIDAAGTFEVSVEGESGTFEILPIPFSNAVLTLDDLPAGFGVMEIEELDMTPDDLDSIYGELGGDTVDFFGFVSGQSLASLAMVFGVNNYPLTALEQTGFNLEVDDPDTLAADLAGVIASGMSIDSYDVLPYLSDIGDKSVGVRIIVDLDSVVMVFDIVIFRSGSIVSVLYVMWLEGYTPSVSSEELAYILADKVAAALASSSEDFTVTPLS